MQNLPLISVVIPVYNTSKFLNKCLDSVLNQTYPNIELVIVNDCSTDDSEKIIKNYANKYSNIRVVKHEVNRGLFHARLSGFKVSKGEYIAFLDSDDSVSRDYYRKMLSTLIKNDADICLADWVWENENGEWNYHSNEEIRNTDFVYDNNQILDKLLKGHGYNFSWHVVWNKLIKREVVEKAYPFLEEFSNKVGHLIMAEDIAYSTSFYIFANKVVNCHNVYYYYFIHSQQSTSIKDVKKYEKSLNDVINVLDYLERLLKRNNLYKRYEEDYIDFRKNYYNRYYDIAKEYGFLKKYQSITKDKKEDKRVVVKIDTLIIGLGQEYKRYEEILKNITDKSTKVVSFDIFDTLLLRKTLEPKDIFIMLSYEFRNELSSSFITRFEDIRMNAEYFSRFDCKNYETDLDKIYEYMVKNYSFDRSLAERIKAREIELEIEQSAPRLTGKDLYDIAMLNNKKVVYTSDMYLPAQTIKAMLSKNGYDIENLFLLSCEHGESKSLGGLYKVLTKKTNTAGQYIVHIGDNYHSDFDVARKNGINAFHMPKAAELFYNFIYNNLTQNNRTYIDIRNINYIGLRQVFATVTNKLFDFPFINFVSDYQCSTKFLGYYAVGMHLLAFTSWVIENAKNRNTIHFVARDGYVPMLAYEIIKESSKTKLPNLNYLYMSRKFLYPLTIENEQDFLSSMCQINYGKHSIKKIIKYFPEDCINKDYYNSLTDKQKNTKFKEPDIFAKNIKLISKCINYNKLQEYRKKVKNYLVNIISDNDVLVDIGYSGRAETILSKLLGYSVNSLYMHSNSDTLYFNKDKAGFENKCFYEYKPKVTGVLRELVYMKTDASFLGYKFKNDEVVADFDTKNEKSEMEFAIVETIQANAINFVKDLMENNKNCLELLAICPKELLVQPWENYLHNSSWVDKMIFKDFLFEDTIGEGYINIIDNWNWQNYNSADMVKSEQAKSKLRRIADKILPPGTRRRRFASKMAHWLIPVGSKRRAFVKKLLIKK